MNLPGSYLRRQRANPPAILRALAFLRPVWRTAVVAVVVIMLRVLVEALAVYFLSPAISSIVELSRSPQASDFLSWLTSHDAGAGKLRSVLMWAAGTQLALAATNFLKPVWESKLSMQAVFHIRSLVFDRLQSSGFALYDRMTSGTLINRALSDLQVVRNFVNLIPLATVDILCTIVAYGAMLVVCSPWLGLALLGFLPLWWLTIVRFGSRAQTALSQQQQASDRLMTALTENIAGVHVVRAFGAEARETGRFDRLSTGLLERVFDVIRLQQVLTPAMKLVAAAAHITLFTLASWLILRGEMQIGDLLVLGIAMSAMLGKIQHISQMVDAYQRAKVSAARLFEVIDHPSETEATRHAVPLSLQRGAITLDNVSFGYVPGKPVLQSFSTTIPDHKITAVLGPTGAGKSTLAALIGRFYDPWQGRVLLDGQDLRTVAPQDLRRVVGFVFQETFLFSASIRDNIRYGRPDVSDEMVQAAAVAAQAHAFITAMPAGYDTPLGEKGVMLSGGQRQRLALARALVYDPKILVLDDATASLDATTEQALHQMVRPWLTGRTVIIVAHRINTVKHADKILVLSEGRILQEGSHRELRQVDGLYRDLVRMQLVGRPIEFSEDEASVESRSPVLSSSGVF
jgi:ATP-binding cassette subfamily B protein